MKKILQISNYFYPNIGGIEQVTRDFANALMGKEIEQKIICFNEDATDGEIVCHRKDTVHDYVDGIEIIRCGCITKVASQSISLKYASELRKVMDDFKPDIVVFHYPNPFVTLFLMQYQRRPFKLVLYWHLDITKQKLLKKLFHKQNIALCRWACKIVCTSPIYAKSSEYANYFGEKIVVLPNTINEQRLQISSQEIEAANEFRKKYTGKVLCFFIGRHIPYKGLKYLIEASCYLKDNIRIIIAGNGELTEELKKQANGNQKIEFVGKISDTEWRSYLKACDIFCFPSITKNEAFGIALAEGMYYEKPSITFTIPGSGVNYVSLNGVTGIECPNGDSRAYATAIEKLSGDQQLCKEYGKNARQRVLDFFTYEQFKKNVCALIESL